MNPPPGARAIAEVAVRRALFAGHPLGFVEPPTGTDRSTPVAVSSRRPRPSTRATSRSCCGPPTSGPTTRSRPLARPARGVARVGRRRRRDRARAADRGRARPRPRDGRGGARHARAPRRPRLADGRRRPAGRDRARGRRRATRRPSGPRRSTRSRRSSAARLTLRRRRRPAASGRQRTVPSRHSNASRRRAFGSSASNSSVSQVANARSTSAGIAIRMSRDGATKRAGRGPNRRSIASGTQDGRRGPAVTRLEEVDRGTSPIDPRSTSQSVRPPGRAGARLPSARSASPARSTGQPARWVVAIRMNAGPASTPEPDGHARRHDRQRRRIDRVAERPRPLEDGQDVVRDVLPGEPAGVEPAAGSRGSRGSSWIQPGRHQRAANARGGIRCRGCAPALRHGPIIAPSPAPRTYRRLIRRLPPGRTWTTDSARTGGPEVGRLAVDEHVDVRPQPRPGLDQPVAHPGHGPRRARRSARRRSRRRPRSASRRPGTARAASAAGGRSPRAQSSRTTASTRPDLGQRVGDHPPRRALVRAVPQLAGARPEGDPDRVERVAGHRLAQDRQVRVVRRQPVVGADPATRPRSCVRQTAACASGM